MHKVGLRAFTSFIERSSTFIPVTSDAAAYTANGRVLVRKPKRTSLQPHGSATETHTLFKQAYVIMLYSIHVFLNLAGSPSFHATARSDQKSSRVRLVANDSAITA